MAHGIRPSRILDTLHEALQAYRDLDSEHGMQVGLLAGQFSPSRRRKRFSPDRLGRLAP